MNSDEYHGSVPRVPLHLNPGHSRVLSKQLRIVDKFRENSVKSTEVRKRKFLLDVDKTLRARRSFYDSLIKLNPQGRQIVEKIKQKRNDELEHNIGIDEKSIENSGKVSPSWLVESTMNAGVGSKTSSNGSVEGSRRSSLKSNSVLELDYFRTDSPGPVHTEEPLAAMIKGSISSAPEVVVTKPAFKSEEINAEVKGDSKNKILDLMPAPIPTRFLGKMHAVLQNINKPEDLSRKSSLVSEVIQEIDIEAVLNSMDDSEEEETYLKDSCSVASASTFKGWMSKRSRTPAESSASPSSWRGSRKGNWRKLGQNSFDQSGRRRARSPSICSLSKKRSPSIGSRGSSPEQNLEEVLSKMMTTLGIRDHEMDEKGKTLTSLLEESDEVENEYWTKVDSINQNSNIVERGFLKELEGLTEPKTFSTETLSQKKGMFDFMKGMSTTSRFVGKLHSWRSGQQTFESDDEELGTRFFKGIPTSFRYLGKSVAVTNIKRGPNNIIVGTPPQGEEPDFSQTVNMLTMLSKADVKLKQKMVKRNDEIDTSKHGRRDSRTSASKLDSSSASNHSESRTSSNTKNVEEDDEVKTFFESLTRIRTTSIPHWNLHRHVIEDKKIKPYYISLQTHRAIGDEELYSFHTNSMTF